jgi:hypothetical protein
VSPRQSLGERRSRLPSSDDPADQDSLAPLTRDPEPARADTVVALPLAAGVLAPVEILLSPAVGALLMSSSTVIVAINAQVLRRVDLALPERRAGGPFTAGRSTD